MTYRTQCASINQETNTKIKFTFRMFIKYRSQFQNIAIILRGPNINQNKFLLIDCSVELRTFIV